MIRHEARDVSFAAPQGWEDRSVVAFAAPPRPGQKVAANVVMTRDALPPGETLTGYADRQLVELAKRLDRFTLHQRRELALQGVPAVEIRFAWQSHAGPLEQRLLMAVAPRGALLNFTMTAPASEAAAAFGAFDELVATVRFH